VHTEVSCPECEKEGASGSLQISWSTMNSPFLSVPESEWIVSNRLAFAIYDRFPVTDGHALVITRRLVQSWLDATVEEKRALLDLVDDVIGRIADGRCPDGFNVGFNIREAAGQTVDHLHIHVIPRYVGDVPDPRGGVRHVIPVRGNYLRTG
jgi:diadenosine tetraphosphate (Ap4A) HIT family hydrolase